MCSYPPDKVRQHTLTAPEVMGMPTPPSYIFLLCVAGLVGTTQLSDIGEHAKTSSLKPYQIVCMLSDNDH